MKISTKQKIKIPEGGIFTWCQQCREYLDGAGNHGVIKNRNDSQFWGLSEKLILCGACLELRKENMPTRKKYLFNEYLKRGYWKK